MSCCNISLPKKTWDSCKRHVARNLISNSSYYIDSITLYIYEKNGAPPVIGTDLPIGRVSKKDYKSLIEGNTTTIALLPLKIK